MAPELKQYEDLLANVRRDRQFHSIRNLVQPDDPNVKEVADVLIQAPDFIEAAQDFVAEFASYQEEVGDYWGFPFETLAFKYGDCDDLAILLCSILRNGISADKVFCAIGTWEKRGEETGHMWVTIVNQNGRDRIVEATAPSYKRTGGTYRLSAIFNDEYTWSTARGLKEFGLMPFEEVIATLEMTGAIKVPAGG
ncbi:hypothetical protein LCGC14_2979100 [marine sediment metagenome]|uniref:Transglutaminase-like domain-containing protein n=1 Tax=marine sediment metagenome TaxID=412755 RepID=A0A0F8ZEP7_9ZZZZ